MAEEKSVGGMEGLKKKSNDKAMIVNFDGGLRRNLIAIVNAGTNEVIIEKRKYNNDDYEWDALELALDYIKEQPYDNLIQLVGDNNQIIRWMKEDEPLCDSIIKQKCAEKLHTIKAERNVYPQWVKRSENLAGRVLEHYTSKSSKPTKYFAVWYGCSKCTFKSLVEKEKSEHFYNEHITNG